MAPDGLTRVIRIAIASVLMLATVFVVAGSLRTANEPALVPAGGRRAFAGDRVRGRRLRSVPPRAIGE